MVVHAAGILPYRRSGEGVVVFLGHMGGPYWSHKDDAAWSVLKGEVEEGETFEDAARREFFEESGVAVAQELHDIGVVRLSSGKRIHLFTCEADTEWVFVASGTFETQWPPRSGRTRTFPEIDRAQWCTLDVARTRLVVGQRPAIDALEAYLAAAPPSKPTVG